MPIINSKQSWKIGDRVNVGIMKNLLVTKIEAIYDGLPDIYTLESNNGNLYQFTPHNGIERIN